MLTNASRRRLLVQHQAAVRQCQQCPGMHRAPILGNPVLSPVLLVGQAPGAKEPALGRPFAWTAGKELFKWFTSIGVEETAFRTRVYMAAVCRCYPGKNPKGGDRVPATEEIERCRPWLEREIELLRPRLIIPVGRLAIEQFLPPRPLVEQVGRQHRVTYGGHGFDAIPLPHPSGASTWPRTEPGKTLTRAALKLISVHSAWRSERGIARAARACVSTVPARRAER